MKIWEFTFGKGLPSVRVAGVLLAAVLALLPGGTGQVLADGPAFAAEVVIHVAPTGDDAGDGSQAKPVASLGVEDGKWSLAVTLPGQETKTFADLPYLHQGFRQLTWFGLMSSANATTTSYVDGVALSVR